MITNPCQTQPDPRTESGETSGVDTTDNLDLDAVASTGVRSEPGENNRETKQEIFENFSHRKLVKEGHLKVEDIPSSEISGSERDMAWNVVCLFESFAKESLSASAIFTFCKT